MSGIRVLEAITPSRIGGAEVYVADLCAEMARQGAEVELFCPAGRPFVDFAARRGIASTTWKTHGKLDPVTVIRLARLMRTCGLGVIHTHLSTAGLLGAFAARLARGRSVAHVHGMNTATCFRYSTAIIAVSEAVKSHLCRQGIRAEKVHVVHNGVDLARFRGVRPAEAKARLGYDAGAPLLGVFGRLAREKGQSVALEAMFILLKSNPRARLAIVGDGADRHDLETAASALGIAASVQFAGFVPDVASVMSACDIVLVPSLREGFGLAAVEAMALERPVIASAVGGLPEIVVPNETGFLTAPNDPRDIARAAGRLIDDPFLAHHMAECGRERAAECFNLKKQVARVLTILAESDNN